MNELNHDIYICIQDKKSNKTHQFSSDLAKFGNLHIAGIAKDTDLSLQKIEKFNSCVSKMQDKHLKLTGHDCNESSAESKKPTEASVAD